MTKHQRLLSIALATFLAAPLATAGGTPENAVLIVDPANAESLYVANYYQAMRDIPACNIFHMQPGAVDYPSFASTNLPAFLGTLSQRRIEDHADYVVIPPGGSFYVDAPGLINDPCVSIRRFSIATGYVMAYNSADILGGLLHSERNHYCQKNYKPRAFQSDQRWLIGQMTNDPAGKRYFISGMLGYTGPLGNTVPEILAMIDRSIAADGTRPTGTVYYMETTDTTRSSPRHNTYPAAVSSITNFSGQAQHLLGDLPIGQHDCMGIMTGRASPAIDAGNFTMLPGSFADHLTSYAGRFDTSSQVKMSRWIAKGASGTAGTVEEPCNYAGKFPHARVHVEYFKGLSLGEAWLRSSLFVPFQPLFYGDPLTRAYAYTPVVDVPNPPMGTIAGWLTITPAATSTMPNVPISELQLLVDGVSVETIPAGGSFSLDTRELADGWHELRVLAHDASALRNTNRWVGSTMVQNHGNTVALTAMSGFTGDLASRFDFGVSATGPGLREIRLISNGRVVAATTGTSATVSVHGQNLGAGPRVRVRAEALFASGRRALSAPIELTIDYLPGAPSAATPLAYDYIKRVQRNTACIIELPAAFAEDPATAVFTILQPPAQASMLSSGTAPYLIVQPNPGSACTDTLTFQVTTAAGTSNVATVTLEYGTPETLVYGCGVNPAGSMSVLSGTPTIGATVMLGLDDPTSTLSPGALPIVYVSNRPNGRFPCGRLLPGFGIQGVGELLIRTGSSNLIMPPLIGSAWSGAGNPSPVAITIPSDCNLIGTALFAQGLFVNTPGSTGVKLALTDAVRLKIGP